MNISASVAVAAASALSTDMLMLATEQPPRVGGDSHSSMFLDGYSVLLASTPTESPAAGSCGGHLDIATDEAMDEDRNILPVPGKYTVPIGA